MTCKPQLFQNPWNKCTLLERLFELLFGLAPARTALVAADGGRPLFPQPPDQGVDPLCEQQADHDVDPPGKVAAEDKHVDERRRRGAEEHYAPRDDSLLLAACQGPQHAEDRVVEER